jgi:hypothetical protein
VCVVECAAIVEERRMMHVPQSLRRRPFNEHDIEYEPAKMKAEVAIQPEKNLSGSLSGKWRGGPADRLISKIQYQIQNRICGPTAGPYIAF